MASNNPKVRGFCEAGCAWRVPHYDEFQKSATYIEKYLSGGSASVDAVAKYKIKCPTIPESIKTLSEAPKVTGGAAVLVGNTIWHIWQSDGGVSVQAFDPEAGTYTGFKHQGDIACANPAAAAVGEDIYIFCGNDENEIVKFDTSAKSFSIAATMGVNLHNTHVAAIGTSIYIIGGDAGENLSNKIYKFDTVGLTVTEEVTLPYPLSYSTVAAVDKKIYIFGGFDETEAVNKILVFDTAKRIKNVTELFEILPTFVLLDNQGCFGIDVSAATVGNDIYLFGGSIDISHTSSTSAILKFDTDNETLEYLYNALPDECCGIVAASYGSKIYLFGGQGEGGTVINKIQEFQAASFDVDLKLKYYDNGESKYHKIPVTIFDEYKNEFIFEICGIKAVSTIDDINYMLAVCYECNGRRTVEYISGENLSISSTLKISNADKLYYFNSSAEILADNGEDGKSVFIRYSAKADGTDFTEEWSAGQNYIGFATADTAPTDKSEYKWSLFNGASSTMFVRLSNLTEAETADTETKYTVTSSHTAQEINAFLQSGFAYVSFTKDTWYLVPFLHSPSSSTMIFSTTTETKIITVEINDAEGTATLTIKENSTDESSKIMMIELSNKTLLEDTEEYTSYSFTADKTFAELDQHLRNGGYAVCYWVTNDIISLVEYRIVTGYFGVSNITFGLGGSDSSLVFAQYDSEANEVDTITYTVTKKTQLTEERVNELIAEALAKIPNVEDLDL